MEDNKKNKISISLAIIVVGVLIAGAILLRGNKPAEQKIPTDDSSTDQVEIKGISAGDFILGNPNAEVVMIEYADYQCPYCGKFFTETVEPIIKKYVDTGKIAYVFRDFAFLGPESIKTAEAASCANDQGKYWEYHNYIFTHQNGENKGSFADKNLKAFAETLGLETNQFNTCLDSGKYTEAVKTSTTLGGAGGVNGTPHSFFLKNGKIINQINGAYPLTDVSAKLDAVLK
jgi:protein-disulfide isomerase